MSGREFSHKMKKTLTHTIVESVKSTSFQVLGVLAPCFQVSSCKKNARSTASVSLISLSLAISFFFVSHMLLVRCSQLVCFFPFSLPGTWGYVECLDMMIFLIWIDAEASHSHRCRERVFEVFPAWLAYGLIITSVANTFRFTSVWASLIPWSSTLAQASDSADLSHLPWPTSSILVYYKSKSVSIFKNRFTIQR